MEYTKKLHLNLPEDTDPLEVSKLSENFRKIDDFAADAGSPYKVGDIRLTQRTDLGEDWLLCNGEPLDAGKYPELAGMMPGLESMAGLAAVDTIPNNYRDALYGGYATDGENQLFTTYGGSASSAGATYLMWSKDNFKTTTRVNGLSAYQTKAFYCNGNWIIFFFAGAVLPSSSSYVSTIAYAAQAFGGITNQYNLSVQTIQDVYHVEYVNGKYYAFCKSGAAALVVESSTPHFDDPKFHKLSSGATVFSFVRAEGKFAFILNNSKNKISAVYYSDSPTTGYQTRTVPELSTTLGLPSAHTLPTYAGGRVFWPTIGSSLSAESASLIYLEGIESGGVGYVDLPGPCKHGCIKKLLDVGNGQFAIFTNGKDATVFRALVCSGDPANAGSWTNIGLSVSPGTDESILQTSPQFVQNGAVCALMRRKVLSIPISAVPRISIDNCNVYIKAK